MDCYIVRIYRRITGKNGNDDEIAGLVERVGANADGKPFSSYQGLITMLQEDPEGDFGEKSADMPATGADIRIVRGSS
jgi:hypothetical protein